MTIDWTKPICLDTVPPRMATLLGGPDSDGDYRVEAVFDAIVGSDYFHFAMDGRPTYDADLPTVRNVRPGDFAPDPRDAAIAGLVKALRACDGLLERTDYAPDSIAREGIAAALTAWEAVK